MVVQENDFAEMPDLYTWLLISRKISVLDQDAVGHSFDGDALDILGQGLRR